MDQRDTSSTVTLRIGTPRASEQAAEFICQLIKAGAVLDANQDAGQGAGDALTVTIHRVLL